MHRRVQTPCGGVSAQRPPLLRRSITPARNISSYLCTSLVEALSTHRRTDVQMEVLKRVHPKEHVRSLLDILKSMKLAVDPDVLRKNAARRRPSALISQSLANFAHMFLVSTTGCSRVSLGPTVEFTNATSRLPVPASPSSLPSQTDLPTNTYLQTRIDTHTYLHAQKQKPKDLSAHVHANTHVRACVYVEQTGRSGRILGTGATD